MAQRKVVSFLEKAGKALGKFFKTVWKGIRYGLKLLGSAGIKFQEDYCFQRAASLAYSTFLSLMPIVILMLSILTTLKLFNTLQDEVTAVIRSNFMPEQADILLGYFNQFAQNIGSINSIAIIGFLLAGVFLLITLENHLNVVWKVDKSRSFFRAFINNWTVLTLGPILISASIIVTRQFKVLAAANPLANYKLVSFLSSFLITSFLFIITQFLMPNTKVKAKAAIIGGVISSLGYELLRTGYSVYAKISPRNLVFGSIAVIFFFILWMFCVWIIFLYGAQLAFFIQYPSMLRAERKKVQNPFYRDLLVWITINYHYINRKDVLDMEILSDYYPYYAYRDIAVSVQFLTDKKLIASTEERGFVPYSSPSHTSLGEAVCSIMGLTENSQIVTDPKKETAETYIVNETIRLIGTQIAGKYRSDVAKWIESVSSANPAMDKKVDKNAF